MRIHSVSLTNYGPFQSLSEVKLGPLATIIGQNDAGKSNILEAIQTFFEGRKLLQEDIYDGAKSDKPVVIEVAFSDFPEIIQLEKEVNTTFIEEKLLDNNGFLRIRKVFNRKNLGKPNNFLITQDFDNNSYSGLTCLKENELNERCKSLGIEFSRSGRGVTNKGKRNSIRQKAIQESTNERLINLAITEDLWKIISNFLPEFILFEVDTKLDVDETSFQSQFRPIVKAAAEKKEVVKSKNAFVGAINKSLQEEVNKIFEKMKKHTNSFQELRVQPDFSWDKAVTFDIYGKDQFGIEKPIGKRGSGMRRLLMVAFFQYLVERKQVEGNEFIFAVEEPENCLHPKLQRELAQSFRQLANEGSQVIITSHSPVFAGSSTLEDLALIVREAGIAKSIQSPDLNYAEIADQLGVEPSDQLTSYNACVFVEGPSDIEFWNEIAKKLKSGGHLQHDFIDKNIGFIISGGDTLKYWINKRAMKRLNRHYGVIVDSDRESPNHVIPQRKINWKTICESEGGKFFILRKREIENYIHPSTLARVGKANQNFDDYSDMKKIFGENVYLHIRDMTDKEILEMGVYQHDKQEYNEILDIVETLLKLGDT